MGDGCSLVGLFLSELGNQGPLVLDACLLVGLILSELGIEDLSTLRHAPPMGNLQWNQKRALGRHAIDH